MFDPFAVLGLPRRFTLDGADLQRRFIGASAQNHPDRHTDPLEQADAAERSAVINEAYRALSDPQARAEALLNLLAGARGPSAAPGRPAGADALPPNLLMEMMEARERMEEAQAGGDQVELAACVAWAREQMDERLGRLGELLDRAASAPPSGPAEPELLTAARLELNAIRYFKRMIDQAPDAQA